MIKRVAYITDIHLDEEFPKILGVDSRNNWKAILKDIDSKDITEIIYGGDIGKKSSNSWFFDSLKKYNLSITLGNHDVFSEAIKYYKNGTDTTVSELFYSQENVFLN
ncbi:metallophosphoesterase [Aquimarina sp. M1]